MKLDKVQFAKVIAFIVEANHSGFDDDAIETLDRMIDIDVPTIAPMPVVLINELVKSVAAMAGDGDNTFIPAIKAYRALTGCTLLEGKTFIEQYRNNEVKRSKQEMYRKLNAESYAPDVDHVIARFIDKCF